MAAPAPRRRTKSSGLAPMNAALGRADAEAEAGRKQLPQGAEDGRGIVRGGRLDRDLAREHDLVELAGADPLGRLGDDLLVVARRQRRCGSWSRRAGCGSSIASGSARSDANRRSSRARTASRSSPPETSAVSVSQVLAPSRRRESSGSTSSAGGNDDHGAVEPPPGSRRRSRPSTPVRRRRGDRGGSVAIRSRVTGGAVGDQVGESPRRRARSPRARSRARRARSRRDRAAPRRTSGRAASREAKTVAIGSSISASTVTLTSVAPAARTSDRLPEALEDARGIDHRTGAQCSGRDLVIATSPVRAISISPWGRTMRSKESILSWVPVTSIVSERRETSTILPS